MTGEKTHNSIPPFVGATGGVRFPHKVCALVVLHELTAEIVRAAGHDGGSLKRDVQPQRVLDVLLGGGLYSLHVAVAHGGQRGVLLVQVARGQCGVIGAAMVVVTANSIKGVDGIGLRGGGAVTAVRGAVVGVAVSCLCLALDDIERSVRHVAGKSLGQGGVALVLMTVARAALRQLAEGLAVTAGAGAGASVLVGRSVLGSKGGR